MNPPLFRLYIDESGDHTTHNLEDPHRRYLALMGVWFEKQTHYLEFARSLRNLKESFFGFDPDSEPACLHRRDLINRSGAFSVLRDPRVRGEFDQRLIQTIAQAEFKMCCVAIDKLSHTDKSYRSVTDAYHYCLAVLLERYVDWLTQVGAHGDVMAESRGGAEDRALGEAYSTVLQRGTNLHPPSYFSGALTSSKLKLKKKLPPRPGLELADLLASPVRRQMIAERNGQQEKLDFGWSLLNTIFWKFHQRQSDGRVTGYGKVWLD